MSFRFQKRVRVAPGVRINFSKRGISASAGPRGASVTLGRRGVHGNAGIPGTGLSYRTRLDKPNRKNSFPSTRTAVQSSTPQQDNIQVEWKEVVQDFSFSTKDGRTLNDYEERQVRRSYKNELLKMYEEKAKDINGQTERLLDLHHHLFQPAKDFTNIAEESLPPVQAPPDKDNMLSEIINELKGELSLIQKLKMLFPAYKKEFNDKVMAKTEQAFKEQSTTHTKEKKEFETELAHRQQLANGTLSGNRKSMEDWVSLFLDELDFPLETDVDFQIPSANEIYVDIDLPTLDEVPIKKATLLKTGRIKIQDKSQREHREDYALMVGGTAFYLASFFFRYLPTIEFVYVSGYNQILNNATGHNVDQYIYSLKIDKKVFYSLKMENVHPISAFENFEPKINVTKTFIFKEIEPYAPPSTL